MFKYINPKSLLFRYILSYLIILVIPTTAITVLVYKNAASSLQKEINNASYFKLVQVKEFTDSKFRDMDFIVSQIESDSILRSNYINQGPYQQIEAIRRLSLYRLSKDFVNDIYLYFRGSSKILSSIGAYDVDFFSDSLYRFQDWEKNRFLIDINQVKEFTVRPTEKVNIDTLEELEVLPVFYPLPIKSDHPEATVSFLIRKSVLQEIIDNILGDLKGSAYIIDRTGQILISAHEKLPSDSIELMSILHANKDKNVFEAKINQINHTFIQVHSDKNDWIYLTELPSSQFLSGIWKVRFLVIQILALVLLLGISLVIILSLNNYRPVKKLVKSIRLYVDNSSDSRNSNEFNRLSNTVSNMINQNQRLETLVGSQEKYVRNHTLENIIYGKVKNPTEFNKLVSISKLELNSGHCFLLLLSINNPYTEELENLAEHLEIFLASYHHKALALELAPSYNLAVICFVDNNIPAATLQMEVSSTIQSYFEQELGLSCVIGVGGMYESYLYINRSFVEASAALEYAMMKKHGSVVLFNDIKQSQTQEYWYPAQEQMRFIQSLKLGKKAVAIENLNDLITVISENQTSMIMFKYLCYDIVLMIAKTVVEMKLNNFTEDIDHLMVFADLNELKRKLEDFIEKFCDYLEGKKEERNNDLSDAIMDYINKNYTDNCISLESISDHFGLSIFYLSRFFKDQTDTNFSDYLSNLRIQKAKKLLLETDLTINSIVEKIGYLGAKSFMRKFKLSEGVTLGEFREIHKKK